MDKAIRAIVIILVVSPLLWVSRDLLWIGLVLADRQDPANPHEIISAKELWDGIRPYLFPYAVGAYVYILFLVFIFVGSRKAA